MPPSPTTGHRALPLAATRFSGLTDITASNAKNLHAKWSFSTGVLGGHEGQPLVVGSTMYVVTLLMPRETGDGRRETGDGRRKTSCTGRGGPPASLRFGGVITNGPAVDPI
jgi:hypothetical protein